MTISTLFKVSRPRFWVYLAGPVAIAFAGGNFASLPIFMLLLLYATLPANLLIYGVNDLFDRDTDALNDKKTGYEHRLNSADDRALIFWIIVTNLPFLVTFAFLLPSASLWWIALFLFTGVGYSAPPIRAKTKPVLDALFNILYACLGFATYSAITMTQPSISIVVAALCWCAAMHAYSAVPDIEPDARAGLKTIATTFGAQWTLIICGTLYIVSALLSVSTIGLFSIAAGTCYAVIIGMSLRVANGSQLMSIYRSFPIVNTVIGMALWFWVALFL